MNVSLKKQDLPPAGGYAPIVYKRIPPKGYFNGFGLIATYLAVTAASLGLYTYTYVYRTRESVEARSARFAIQPLLQAERDRAFLKQLRKNRDAETELMKNVKGWEVGTLYGEPVYKTIPEDSIWWPIDAEFYAHADKKDWSKRFYFWHVHSVKALDGSLATEKQSMDSKRKIALTEYYTQVATEEVLHELEKTRFIEEQKRSRKTIRDQEEQRQRQELEKLQNEFPLYRSSAFSLYNEKYGRQKLHPFNKRTDFSKPIHEHYDVTFM